MQALPTIIGAGPTGLLLGCLLQQQGVDCQIIERLPEPSWLTRAVMIHSASLDILDQIGVAIEVIALGLPQRFIHFQLEDGERYSLDFDQLSGMGYPGFINLRQPVLEAVLARRFSELGGKILRGRSLLAAIQNAAGVSLSLDGPEGPHTLTVPWLVGCDGANSTVRQMLGGAFSGRDYPYSYVLAEGTPRAGTGSFDAIGEASYMLINAGAALSVVPMENGEIRIAGPGLAEDLTDRALDASAVEAIFGRTGLRGLPQIAQYSATRQYRVRERVAERFAEGRIFLCGDAAHLHSPSGGQAMNLGFGDAFALAWRLARHADVRQIAPAYSQERRLLAQAVIERTQIGPLLEAMRNHTLDAQGLVHLTDSFSQLYHHWGDSATPLSSLQLSAGARLPNLWLDGGRRLWQGLTSGWLEVGGHQPAGQALADLYRCRARLKVRPDFVVEQVESLEAA
ncbi:FAD-dependent monooxygenase [Parachitinimonas caeni]|uniref:FAD-dependent monooxygenase n=1 Tax=Parachitinimonas caeni TaxID=3031301 RepID=A0ABT7E2Y6_9NEIS|nr:FAD-dependent monooxygenase [Parachitinimonas caeni]MDK2126681.1 FAD-dependent monooxygenase [Parachitinimonas caeni]